MELIARCAQAAADQGLAAEDGDHEKANRLYDELVILRNELRHRGHDAQRALLVVLDDPRPWARVWAATSALEFASDQAESVLAEIAAGPGVPAINAKYTLRSWRAGELKLP